MKIFKNVLFGIAAIPMLYLFVLGIYFLNQPSAPAAVLKISGTDWELAETFHDFKPEFWEKKEGQLFFNNQSPKKEKVTLFTEKIPSEDKKKGYVTMSVELPGDFAAIADDAKFGFQIGEKDLPEKEQIFIGLNGKGRVLVTDGNFDALSEGKVKIKDRKKDSKQLQEAIKLSLHYYRNPKGWVFFFSTNGGTKYRGGIVYDIPVEKFDSEDKAISLVAFNPSQKGELWFKNWTIQNDWTPND